MSERPSERYTNLCLSVRHLHVELPRLVLHVDEHRLENNHEYIVRLEL